jgi:hypothetical protein
MAETAIGREQHQTYAVLIRACEALLAEADSEI